MTANNCSGHRCTHEWCDRNRNRCDALVPAFRRLGGRRDSRVMTNCGKKTTWLAPLGGPAFPLAYCKDHAPSEQREGMK